VNRTTVGLPAVLGAAVLWGTSGTAAAFATGVGSLAMGASGHQLFWASHVRLTAAVPAWVESGACGLTVYTNW
jgi:hypothetical protein